VDICTPNRAHTPIVVAALNAGLHVICEKPLAVTVKEIKAMAVAAEKNKRILMTAQHMRFTDRMVSLKRFVDASGAGDFYHARVHALRRNALPCAPGFIDPLLSGGGPCMDIGVHALDAAMFLLNFPTPVRVTGTTAVNFAKGDTIPGAWGEWDRQCFGVEDFATGFVHFDNGMTMVLEASWLGHQKTGEDMSFLLMGKRGSVSWPDCEAYSTLNRVLINQTLQPAAGLKPAHTEEIMAFVNAIRQGLPSPVPVEQTIRVIAILEGIYQSARSGREIKIKL
jgi:predicted dehydrogenase